MKKKKKNTFLVEKVPYLELFEPFYLKLRETVSHLVYIRFCNNNKRKVKKKSPFTVLYKEVIIVWHVSWILNIYQLWQTSNRWYPSHLRQRSNRIWHFMQTVSLGDNLHEVPIPPPMKIKKTIQNVISRNFTQRRCRIRHFLPREENGIRHFTQTVSIGDNLHEVPIPPLGKKKTYLLSREEIGPDTSCKLSP